jgi:hypothetical protein
MRELSVDHQLESALHDICWMTVDQNMLYSDRYGRYGLEFLSHFLRPLCALCTNGSHFCMQASENLQEHRILSTAEFADSDVISIHGNHSFVAFVQTRRSFWHNLRLPSTTETLWSRSGMFHLPERPCTNFSHRMM